MTRTPVNAMVTPIQVARATYSPRNFAIKASQSAWVETSAVEAATLVIRIAGIQSAKCAPRSRPALMEPLSSVRVSRRSPPSRRADGSVSPAPSVQRQNAMAIAGAVAAATIGPDVEMATTTMDSEMMSAMVGFQRVGVAAG